MYIEKKKKKIEMNNISEKRFILLDGAMGTLLSPQYPELNLWSAEFLVTDPERVRKVHQKYVEAGANVITTASYQADLAKLEKLAQKTGHDSVTGAQAVQVSVRLARQAIAAVDGAESRCIVAGSLGPYGAVLGQGQEYTGEYGSTTVAELQEFHRARVVAIASALSARDALLFETVPNLAELRVILEVARDVRAESGGKWQVWVSLSLDASGCKLADGSTLDQVVAVVVEFDGVADCVGVNCTAAGTALKGLVAMRKEFVHVGKSDFPFIVYPNSGEVYDALGKTWSNGDGETNVGLREWDQVGVSVIGGCCRTGPEEIGRLRKEIDLYEKK